MFTKYVSFSMISKSYKVLLYRNCSKKTNGILNLKEKHNLNYDTGNKEKEKKLTLGSFAMLIIPAFTFSLGCWQVQRWIWKKNLISKLEKEMEKESIEFPFDDLNKLNSMEYRKIEIEGEFIHDREFLIYPRGRFDDEFTKKTANSSGLVASNDMSSNGAHVITPFKLKGTNLVIMVNRGWIPKNKIAKETRLDTFPTGNLKLSAILRKSENRPQFVSENRPDQGIWFYKNFQQMGNYCGSEPIYVEATKKHSYLPNGPIAGQSNVEIRNKHVEYFLTWYSMTLLTLIMWYIRFLK